jgi:hypothetical protein
MRYAKQEFQKLEVTAQSIAESINNKAYNDTVAKAMLDIQRNICLAVLAGIQEMNLEEGQRVINAVMDIIYKAINVAIDLVKFG